MRACFLNSPLGQAVFSRRDWGRRRALSLAEIMVAMSILAFGLIPIFGLMTQDIRETDFVVAHSFAIDRSRLILGTLIGEIPFPELEQGNPAILTGNSASAALLLFPGGAAVGGGRACLGIASDSRGIRYQLYLRVDAIEDTTPGYTAGELYFSIYRNPRIDAHLGFASMTAQATISEFNNNVPSMYVKTGTSNPNNAISPYRFFGITGITQNLWGPEEEAVNGALRYDQRSIGRPDASNRWCLIKRLVLEIRWNMAQSEYANPASPNGRPQHLRVTAFKANLEN